MGVHAFLGCALISCSAPIVLCWFCIARKSFLCLQALASTFCWTLLCLALSTVLRPLIEGPTARSLWIIGIVAVLVQEVARLLSWRMHRTIVRTLDNIAEKTPGVKLRRADITSLALAQGFGHAASLSIIFCWSWLPLALGKGVLYTDSCPQASVLLTLSVMSVGLFFVNCCGTVISFSALDAGNSQLAAVPAVLHLAAALGTLRKDGCVWVMPAELALGAATASVAALVSQSGLSSRPYHVVPTDVPS